MTGPDARKKAPAEPVLRCEGLHRYLGEGAGRVHVLRGVELEALPGEVCAVVGPSGCGKSTLLYLLGLLDRFDDGEIWIGGEPVSRADEEQRTALRCRAIGFIFQFHFLLPEFSALENVLLPMHKLGRATPGEAADRARELLAAVGLGDKTGRLPSQLSGGEQQRVAIARSLANSPSILLADEPTGNLDEANSGIVFDLLARVARQHGQAVILVTHNPEIARRCDRILPMRDGLFVGRGG
ncbi:MAG: ABC transporter ATP-binding protein [Puniceicoccaceae bacterium]|nr:MAG: ABC transporter ATP-binding protein [Puniceicoccaceae bacterium]